MLLGLKGVLLLLSITQQSLPGTFPPPFIISPINHLPSSCFLPFSPHHQPYHPPPSLIHSASGTSSGFSADPVPHLPGSPSLLTLTSSLFLPLLNSPLASPWTSPCPFTSKPSETDGLKQETLTPKAENERGGKRGEGKKGWAERRGVIKCQEWVTGEII